ncbi:MAG: CRTAC1 family protein [Planctomycetes bacterium]|nr:CRTAC1 family protein [Planctomycetota bacterium]
MLIATVSFGSVAAADDTSIRFTDVTDESGINLVMTSGGTPSREILEVNGGGVAMFDYDNDGDLDLFFANGATMADPEHGPGSRLYANTGRGTFVDVTDQVGISLKRWAMGVAVGDFDGDGCDDLYITCYGPNVLLRNDCGSGTGGQATSGTPGRFIDVTAKAGVGDKKWGTSAAFGDVDGDGDLDLYVVNYLEFDVKNPPDRTGKMYKGAPVMAGPHGLTPQSDLLFENLGDGTFREISRSSGCAPAEPGYGLGVVILDTDGDHRQDIVVGNDSTANFLFRNMGNMAKQRFGEVGVTSGISANYDGSTQASMGLAVGDLDGNGLPDLFSTNFSSDTNTLHLNIGGGFFDDRTSQFGLAMVSRPFLGWGCGFYDFDSDGDEDLFIANGHVYPEAATHRIDSDYEQPPLLFERQPTTRFRRVVDAGPVFKSAFAGRATAFGDLDGDGDVDIVMTTLNGRVRVLRNDSPLRDVVVVELDRAGVNRRGIGSVIELTVGGQTQRRWLIGGGSFQSSNAPIAYFGGLSRPDTSGSRRSNQTNEPPKAGVKVETPEKTAGSDEPNDLRTLRVTWPDGTETTLKDIPLNRRIIVRPDPAGAIIQPLTGR